MCNEEYIPSFDAERAMFDGINEGYESGYNEAMRSSSAKLVSRLARLFLDSNDFAINDDPDAAWCSFINNEHDQMLRIAKVIDRVLSDSGFKDYINLEEIQKTVKCEQDVKYRFE